MIFKNGPGCDGECPSTIFAKIPVYAI